MDFSKYDFIVSEEMIEILGDMFEACKRTKDFDSVFNEGGDSPSTKIARLNILYGSGSLSVLTNLSKCFGKPFEHFLKLELDRIQRELDQNKSYLAQNNSKKTKKWYFFDKKG